MIYAIGDIHGEYEKLKALLAALTDAGMADEDTLVFVGDYIDRGPDTRAVLDCLINLKATRPRTVFLRGNHEQMMLDARERYDPDFDGRNSARNNESGRFWMSEGGIQTIRSYGDMKTGHWSERVPDEHWAFMLDTDLEYEEGGYLFVHAGILPEGKQWVFADFDTDPRLWIRSEFHVSQSDFGGRVVIFGHTPSRDGQPVVSWNKVGIDTGVAYGGPLTAVGLPATWRQEDLLIFQTH
jgi:serine/threonine protein phosphatase 1